MTAPAETGIASKPVRFGRTFAFLIILVVAAVSYARLPGQREFAIFDTTPPTPYFRYTPIGTSRGRLLVVHGLDSSKNVMNILCYDLADAGFEVFAIDLPGHGESTAGFTAFDARDVVDQVLSRLGSDTAVVGHSLGGALFLDIASDRRIPQMVLFSPAPTPLQRIDSDRVLVLIGQFDPGRIRAFIPQIRAAVRGSTDLRDLAWTGHSGGFFEPRVIRDVVNWLGGPTYSGHASDRLFLLAVMLLSSLALGWSLWTFLAVREMKDPVAASSPLMIVYYVAAATISVVILSFVNVVSWLRLFTTDYLVGVLLLTGLLLIVRFRPKIAISARHVLASVAAAAYIIGMVRFTAPEFAHAALSADRWWRFAAIALLGFPLFLADETLLRPASSRRRAAAVALATRLVVGAMAVTGALILNREAAFLLLMAHAVIFFWLLLWFLGGVVRRRTDPFSAALFTTLVQAWIFSALFITT